jgi:Kef-type K+ transport system membrane component KefB
VTGIREVRENQVAQWLTVAALILFVANGAVLALGSHAYGWATLLFAVAVYFAVSTGIVRRPARQH